MGNWLVFDDETVDTIKECDITKYFGESNAGSAYVLYYQAMDLDRAALDLHPPSPHVVEDHSHQRLTDSPASVSQPIPLPPGLSAEPADTGNTETAPLSSPPSLPEVPIPPIEKLPHESFPITDPLLIPMRSATVGPGSSPKASPSVRNGILKHVPSLRVGPDKRDLTAKPSFMSPFPKDEFSEPMSPIAALTSPNGKEKDTEKKSVNWFRRKSIKSGKSRPNLEVATERPPLPSDALLDVSASPSRFHTTGPAPKYSMDSSQETAGLDRPVAPFMFNRRPATASSIARIPSQSTRQGGSLSISDTTSYSSHTTSTSSSISADLHSRSNRPLPSVPASPENSRIPQTPPSAYHRGSEQSRPHRRPTVPPSDFESPKPPARPTTAGASLGSSAFFTRDHDLPPLPTVAVDNPPGRKYGNTSAAVPHLDKDKAQAQAQTKTRLSVEGGSFFSRPKSAHAASALGKVPPTNAGPPTNGNSVKRTSRKLSFTASFPFGNKDRQREKEKVQS